MWMFWETLNCDSSLLGYFGGDIWGCQPSCWRVGIWYTIHSCTFYFANICSAPLLDCSSFAAGLWISKQRQWIFWILNDSWCNWSLRAELCYLSNRASNEYSMMDWRGAAGYFYYNRNAQGCTWSSAFRVKSASFCQYMDSMETTTTTTAHTVITLIEITQPFWATTWPRQVWLTNETSCSSSSASSLSKGYSEELSLNVSEGVESCSWMYLSTTVRVKIQLRDQTDYSDSWWHFHCHDVIFG